MAEDIRLEWASGHTPKQDIRVDDSAAPKPEGAEKPTMSDPMAAVEGFMDQPIGFAQLMMHIAPEPVRKAFAESNNWLSGIMGAPQDLDPDNFDKWVNNREQYIKERRGDGIDVSRMAGNFVNPINWVVAAPGVGGAVGGATEPVTDAKDENDYWLKKGMQTGSGALLGKAISKVGSVIAPELSGSAKKLADAGVDLTPGQMVGGIGKRAEEAAKSFPILGSFIRRGEKQSLETFNQAVINQALEPIGATLPKGVVAGHDAIRAAEQELGKAYNKILPRVQFKPDAGFATDMANVNQRITELPPAQQDQFRAIVANRLFSRINPQTNQIDGQLLKKIESEFNTLSSGYRSSTDAAQRELAYALDDVKAAVRSNLERMNPGVRDELKNANYSYAMFARVRDAAARRATSNSVFTTGDLLQAIKNGDNSVRKGDFAKGDALMQRFAETAQEVLPNKLPDSGTTERAMWDMAGLGGGYLLKPEIPVALGAASLPYTKPGMRFLNEYVKPSAPRKSVGNAMSKIGEEVSPAATAAILNQLGIQ